MPMLATGMTSELLQSAPGPSLKNSIVQPITMVPAASAPTNEVAPADFTLSPVSEAASVVKPLPPHAATTTTRQASRYMAANLSLVRGRCNPEDQTPVRWCTLDEAAPHLRLAPRACAQGRHARARARRLPRVVAGDPRARAPRRAGDHRGCVRQRDSAGE